MSAEESTNVLASDSIGTLFGKDIRECKAASLADVLDALTGGEGNLTSTLSGIFFGVCSVVVSSSMVSSTAAAVANFRLCICDGCDGHIDIVRVVRCRIVGLVRGARTLPLHLRSLAVFIEQNEGQKLDDGFGRTNLSLDPMLL